MKILLYFEKPETLKTSGIGRALKHQIQALKENDIEFTLDPKDSFDIAHVNTYFGKAKSLIKKLRKKGIPVIVHGHSTKEDFKNSFRNWKIMALWFNPNLMWFYKNADLIVTPTEYSKKCIENYGFKTPVYHVSNGIQVEDYSYSDNKIKSFKEYFHLENQKVVMGVGFPFNRKGIKDFFAIAKERPDYKFIWFGHLQHILTSFDVLKAIKNKPENVIMPGYIDNSIIKGAYQYAECLLFPSYEETEGIVVLEALASKCPVLIRDIGVYKDWMIDGVNCYKANNNKEFLNKLDLIVNNDNQTIKENGFNLAKEKCLKNVGKELKQIYTQLLSK